MSVAPELPPTPATPRRGARAESLVVLSPTAAGRRADRGAGAAGARVAVAPRPSPTPSPAGPRRSPGAPRQSAAPARQRPAALCQPPSAWVPKPRPALPGPQPGGGTDAGALDRPGAEPRGGQLVRLPLARPLALVGRSVAVPTGPVSPPVRDPGAAGWSPDRGRVPQPAVQPADRAPARPASPRRPDPAVASRRLPLTRSRAVAIGLAALGLVGFLLAAPAVAGLRQPAPVVPSSAPAVLVVQPGDTLWSIAGRVAPDQDPRAVVAQLRRLNGLSTSATIRAGDPLRLRTG